MIYLFQYTRKTADNKFIREEARGRVETGYGYFTSLRVLEERMRTWDESTTYGWKYYLTPEDRENNSKKKPIKNYSKTKHGKMVHADADEVFCIKLEE